MSVLVSTKDIALVGGLGILAFIILKGGRDLFAALPSLGQGLGETGQGILDFGGQAGAGITDFFGNLNPFQQSNQSSIAGVSVEQPDLGSFVNIPSDNIVNPDGTVSGSPPTLTLSRQAQQQALEGRELGLERQRLENQLAQTGQSFGDSELISARNQIEFNARQQQDINPIAEILERIGAGSSQGRFVSGSISDTPIANLSLSQIIDRFNITASEAADVRARSRDDFGGFDFGSNTGSGISEINKATQSTRPGFGVGGRSEFEGLSFTEIAQRLTGGLLGNF